MSSIRPERGNDAVKGKRSKETTRHAHSATSFEERAELVGDPLFLAVLGSFFLHTLLLLCCCFSTQQSTMLSLESRNVQAATEAASSLYESAITVSPGNDRASGGLGLSRAKSLFSFASLNSQESSEELQEANNDSDTCLSSSKALHDRHHGQTYRRDLSSSSSANASSFREALEPHLRQAREARQRKQKCEIADVHMSIAGSVNVPYMALRHERPFLFDDYSHPLHEALAETLGVASLAELHKVPENELLAPLLHPQQRRVFHAAYDSFVTSFILPLCHSLAIAKNVLHLYSSEKIHYRYQAFPTIRIVRPGDKPSIPTCGLSEGYSIACLQFHVPLTPAVGSNALFTETHPGREDWHPLNAKSFGVGFMFDGTRNLHFDAGNDTDYTRVALDFCVCLYRQEDSPQRPFTDARSCDFPTAQQLSDRFSTATNIDSTFYEEAVIDLSRSDIVTKTNGRGHAKQLLEPSKLLGAPFAESS